MLVDHTSDLASTRHFLVCIGLCLAQAGCHPEPPKAVVVPTSFASAPLAWEHNHPERKVWSNELRSQFRTYLQTISPSVAASDLCPGWASMTADQQVNALSAMAVSLASHESSFIPTARLFESNGTWSIGLFQISYEDEFKWCKMDRASESLNDPLNNIDCAVGEIARVAKSDATMNNPDKPYKGMSTYWSTMRNGSPAYEPIKAAMKTAEGCSSG